MYTQQERKTLENKIDLEVFCLTSHTWIGNKNPFHSLVMRTYKVHPLTLTTAASSLHR